MAYLDSIDYAINEAIKQTQGHYSPIVSDLLDTVRNLASQNRSLKNEVLQLRNELASTKAITNPAQPKSTFKGSKQLQEAMAKVSALQRSLDHAFKQEQADWEQAQLASIAARTKKLTDQMSYEKALKSDYSTAQSAIHRRKAEAQQHGVPGYVGISGEFVKGLFDKEDLTFQTFDQLFSSTVEIHGVEYAVVKADLSTIGSGHTYHLTPARGGR